jgi:replicative DNA helicase
MMKRERLQQLDQATYDKLSRSVPVHDDAAEEQLIGAALRFPERFIDLADLVTPDQFYSPQRGAIWDAMLYLHEDGIQIDVVTVAERLAETKPFKIEPDWRLHEMWAESLTTANAKVWAARIVRTYQVRTVFYEAGRIVGKASEMGADPEELLEMVSGIEEKIQSRRPSIAKTVGDVAMNRLKEISEIRKSGIKPGSSTGFVDIDRNIGGLRPGELVIVAARPAMGKTAFAGNVAEYVSKSRPVLFVSIEMSEGDIVDRLLSSASGVNSIYLRDVKVNDDEMERLNAARAKLANSNLWIADVPDATTSQIAGLARRVKHRCGDLALVVVDYLQLVTHPSRDLSRQEQVSEISRKLKLLARQLNCSVMALSQLSRKCEERTDKRPMLSDLRESGAIEQDADVVGFLYREEVYHQKDLSHKGKAEFIVGKARKGCTGIVRLAFHGETTTFRNAAVMEPEWPTTMEQM